MAAVIESTDLSEVQLRRVNFPQLLALWHEEPTKELRLRLAVEGIEELLPCQLMHAAVAADNRDTVRGLLDTDAQLALMANSRQELPLHVACRLGRSVAAALLLPAMSVEAANSLDGRGRSPLHLAAEFGQVDCLAELLVCGLCNLAMLDSSGRSAVDCAREAGAASRGCLRLLESVASTPASLGPLRLGRLEPARSHGCRDGELRAWGGVGDCVRLANNCFGEVEFPGLGNTAQFCRLTGSCSDADLAQLLLVCWSLRRPSLVLSVHGSHCDKASFRAAWQKGLWKTAAGSGAWIVTDCFSDLARTTGQAVRDFCDAYGPDSVRAIGLCSWGRTAGSQILCSDAFDGCSPAKYQASEKSSSSQSTDSGDIRGDQLDPNHSHLLLVDCGHRELNSCCDVLTQFRCRFEALLKDWSKLSIAANAADSNPQTMTYDCNQSPMEEDDALMAQQVPLCNLLVGGSSSHCLSSLHSSVFTNQSPLLVVAGTGGLAEVLAELLAELDSNSDIEEAASREESRAEILSASSLRWRLQEAWHLPLDAALEAEVVQLRQLITNCRRQIDVFTLDVDPVTRLDGRILGCLLNSASSDTRDETSRLNGEQLRMAMALDRSDVAREKVFGDTDVGGEKRRWRDGDLDTFMLTALRENRVAFVRLFVEQGFGFDKFVTVALLEALYTEDYGSENESSHLFRLSFESANRRQNVTSVSLADIGLLLQYLAGKSYQSPYAAGLNETFHESKIRNSIVVSQQSERLEEFSIKPTVQPVRDLFIWCLLTGRMESAEFLWTIEKECLPAALLAALLLRRLCQFCDGDNAAEREQLEAIADCYEARACGVLESCSSHDELLARENLVRELPNFGFRTSLSLAADSECIKFVSHSCCQELLTIIWRGELSVRSNGPIRFLLALTAGVLLPPLLPFIIYYQLDEQLMDESLNCREIKRVETEGHKAAVPERSPGRVKSVADYFHRILAFYFSPLVRFVYSTLAYIMFISLYSYTLLFRFGDESSFLHPLVFAWLCCAMLEDLRQAMLQHQSLSSYLSSMWHVIDVTSVVIFSVGSIMFIIHYYEPTVRSLFGVQSDAELVIVETNLRRFCRVCFAIVLFLLIFRTLRILSIHISLGPILLMVQQMIIKDLLPFLLILLIITFGYGIAMWSVLFPQTDPDTPSAVNSVFQLLRVSYFQVFGELNLNLLSGESDACLAANSTACPDPWGAWVAPAMLGVHLMLSSCLLMNILIAMFSSTFELIRGSSWQHWSLLRYRVMKEYSGYSPIAPPLIIVWHLILAARQLLLRCTNPRRLSQRADNDPFRISYADGSQKERQLIQWERIRAMKFLRETKDSLPIQGGHAEQAAKPTVLRAAGVNKELKSVRIQLEESFKEAIREFDLRVRRLDAMEAQLGQLGDLMKFMEDQLVQRHEQVISSLMKELKNYDTD